MKRLLLVLALAARLSADEPASRIVVDVRAGAVLARASGERLTLVVSGPGGRIARRAGEGEVSVPLHGDGEYTFRAQLEGAGAFSTDGAFVLKGGEVAQPHEAAREPRPSRAPDVPADYVVDEPLIAQGFACIGGDACQDGEPSEGRVLKLKDTVPVLRFDDTSTLPGLPNNDWLLRGNEPLNQFSLLDVTAGRIPFTVRPSDLNSLGISVAQDGRVGLGTDEPHDALSVSSPTGQALSLEASGLGHTWRLRTNETTGLALEHATAGGDDPSLLQILPSGQVGLGAAVPHAPLHVRRADGTARVLVEETHPQVIGRNLLRLANNGPSTFRFDNSATGGSWGFGSLNTGDFFIAASGAPALAARLTSAGLLTVAQVVQTSDRDAKRDIATLDPQATLQRVGALPLATWRLEPGLGDGARHIGPMAQDFAAVFGLGADDRHVSASDLAGVALAAVQGAAERADAAARRTAAVRGRAQDIREQLAAVEAGTPLPSLTVEAGPDSLVARAGAGRLTLTVSGPRGVVLWQAGESSELVVALVDEQGRPLGDGQYTYEARLTAPANGDREAQAADACTGRPGRCGLLREVTGAFVVRAGLLVRQAEPAPAGPRTAAAPGPSLVVNEDLIVQGAACFGSSACQDGESFTGDTLRLKGSVPALRFEDSDSSPGESQRDWLLRANEPLDQFSLLDLTAGTVPFTVRAGAPNHSLYLDPIGRLGLGTSTPSEALSVVRDDAPRLSLESTATAERWTLGPTATGDAFSVVAEAPLSASVGGPSAIELLQVAGAAAGGGVGLGVVPQAPLHVRRGDGSGRVLIEETSAPVIGRNLLRLVNHGPSTFRFDNSATAASWGFGSLNTGDFFIAASGTPALAATLTSAGVLTVAQVVQTSDRARKRDIEPVDAADVLERVAALPVPWWRFKPGHGDEGRHLGPMAQDFAAAFGLGADERLIAPSDMAGVALAAIGGLESRLAAREAELAVLEREQAELQERLERLARPAPRP